MEKSRKILLNSLIIFIVLLILLIFFSKTIYEYNLPAVTVEFPKESALTYTANRTGKVITAEENKYFSEYSGKIKMLAEKNEFIEAGAPLYEIQMDTEEIEKEITSLEYSKKTLINNLSKINSDITYYSNLKNDEILPSLSLTEEEANIKALQEKTTKANEELQKLLLLFTQGAIPKEDMNKKEQEIEALKASLTLAKDKKEEKIKNYNKEIEKATQNHEKTITENRKRIEDLNYEKINAQLDIENVNIRIRDLNTQLKNGDKITVNALYSGYVKDITEELNEKIYINKNEYIMSITPIDSGLKAGFLFNDEIKFIQEGDICALKIPSKNYSNIQGKITRIYTDNEQYGVDISFDAEDVFGGETVEVKFSKKTEIYPKTLPNSAVHENENGYFVYIVEQARTSFGNEYIAKEQFVGLREQSNTTSAVGLSDNVVVITNSNNPLSDNTKVKLVNRNDIVGIR